MDCLPAHMLQGGPASPPVPAPAPQCCPGNACSGPSRSPPNPACTTNAKVTGHEQHRATGSCKSWHRPQAEGTGGRQERTARMAGLQQQRLSTTAHANCSRQLGIGRAHNCGAEQHRAATHAVPGLPGLRRRPARSEARAATSTIMSCGRGGRRAKNMRMEGWMLHEQNTLQAMPQNLPMLGPHWTHMCSMPRRF